MLTKSSLRNWQVFLSAAFGLLLIVAIWLAVVGASDDTVGIVVRMSGRFMFAVYLLVIAIRPLQQILRQPWSSKLLRRRRLVGVAFAGFMSAHLVTIVLRDHISPSFEFEVQSNLPGALVYALMYAMFATSFDGPAKALGPRAWKMLHRVGLIALGIAFVLPDSIEQFNDPYYWTYVAPLVAIISLRTIVWRRLHQPDS